MRGKHLHGISRRCTCIMILIDPRFQGDVLGVEVLYNTDIFGLSILKAIESDQRGGSIGP